jgi:hypothetical protein
MNDAPLTNESGAAFVSVLHDQLSESEAPARDRRRSDGWLREMLGRLNALIEQCEPTPSQPSGTYVHALHLRATVCSRLLRLADADTPGDPDADALAEQGLRDATTAMRITRDLALQGHAVGRLSLGAHLHRLCVVVEFHPRPGRALAAQAEAAFADCIQLIGPEDSTIVPTGARLGSAFARAALAMCRESDDGYEELNAADLANADELIAASGRWADFAMARLRDPGRPTQADTFESLAACTWNRVMAAYASWSGLIGRTPRLFDLVSQAWSQLAVLEALDLEIADSEGGRYAEMRDMMVVCVIRSLGPVVASLSPFGDDALGNPPDLGAATSLRRIIHHLSEAVWPRVGSAEGVATRMSSPPSADDLHESLRAALDTLEVRCLGAILREQMEQIALLAQHEGDLEQIFGAVYMRTIQLFMQIPPTPTIAHLSVSVDWIRLAAGEPGALSTVEQELEELATKGQPQDDLSATIAAVAQVLNHGPVTDSDWLSRIEVAVRDHCLPLAERDLASGSKYAWFALTFALTYSERLSHSNVLALLDVVVVASRRLADLGEPRPVLELIRADLLVRLSASDETMLEPLGQAANAVLAYVDAGRSLADDPLLFDGSALVRTLRYAGLAAAARDLADPPRSKAAPEGSPDCVERLRAMAADPAVEAFDQRMATAFATELIALGSLARGNNDVNLFGDPDDLVATMPILYLARLLGSEGDPHDTRARVDRAIDNIIWSTAQHDYVTPVICAQLELLTQAESVRRLGLSGSQLITIGQLVRDKLNGCDADAANLALRVARNLMPLRHSPEWSTQFESLAEDIAERFLPTALDTAASEPAVVEFMFARAGAALNFGAMSAAEYEQRIRVALAAHIVAVARDDLDMAARSASLVAEIFRYLGAPAEARRWYGAYDEWRVLGGLRDERFAQLRDAIKADREQLGSDDLAE